jgi:hypothetical protein
MTTGNVARILAGVIIVAQAIISYLLLQTDVVFEGTAKLLLGVAAVGVTTLATYLNVRMPGQSQ